MKDVFFHVNYYYSDETTAYEIMKNGELTLQASFPLFYFDEDGPSTIQVIKDSSDYRNHAIRGINDLTDP